MDGEHFAVALTPERGGLLRGTKYEEESGDGADESSGASHGQVPPDAKLLIL
jgi:hypothetical protein